MLPPMPAPGSSAAVARTMKAVRLRRGWTQQELAFRSGLSVSLVGRIEQGGRLDLRLSTVDALADALGIHPAELLGGRPPRRA